MGDTHELIPRLNILEGRERALKESLIREAMNSLWLAEDGFVDSEILEATGDRIEDGEREQEGPPEQVNAPIQLSPVASPVEASKKALRDELQVAMETCMKARGKFEQARHFTQEEVNELPQPVTQDDIGRATAQKLKRLTRTLLNAEQVYEDAKRRAREAGITNRREQTGSYTDHEDDGYADSFYERQMASGKNLVPQDWEGLYLISQEPTPPRTPIELDRSFRRLESVRVGEDSFDSTEARDRTRRRIDAMRIESWNIRERNSFPEAEPDAVIFEWMRLDGMVATRHDHIYKDDDEVGKGEHKMEYSLCRAGLAVLYSSTPPSQSPRLDMKQRVLKSEMLSPDEEERLIIRNKPGKPKA